MHVTVVFWLHSHIYIYRITLKLVLLCPHVHVHGLQLDWLTLSAAAVLFSIRHGCFGFCQVVS